MVFYAAFNSISVISRRQLTLFMSSWVSPVLGWGSEVSWPRTLPRKNPADPVRLEPRTPGLRVKQTFYHWATHDPETILKKGQKCSKQTVSHFHIFATFKGKKTILFVISVKCDWVRKFFWHFNFRLHLSDCYTIFEDAHADSANWCIILFVKITIIWFKYNFLETIILSYAKNEDFYEKWLSYCVVRELVRRQCIYIWLGIMSYHLKVKK